jgi:hypothetical protein
MRSGHRRIEAIHVVVVASGLAGTAVRMVVKPF